MKLSNQILWGIFFILLSLATLVFVENRVIHLIYGIPSGLIGLSLILFSKREAQIEEVRKSG